MPSLRGVPATERVHPPCVAKGQNTLTPCPDLHTRPPVQRRTQRIQCRRVPLVHLAESCCIEFFTISRGHPPVLGLQRKGTTT